METSETHSPALLDLSIEAGYLSSTFSKSTSSLLLSLKPTPLALNKPLGVSHTLPFFTDSHSLSSTDLGGMLCLGLLTIFLLKYSMKWTASPPMKTTQYHIFGCVPLPKFKTEYKAVKDKPALVTVCLSGSVNGFLPLSSPSLSLVSF